METISIINQKGGVGKTTTTYAIGAGLMKKGFSVLFIDLDSQCNLSTTLGADIHKNTILDVLQKKKNIVDTIQQCGIYSIVSSSTLLSGADIMFTHVGKEYILKEALSAIEDTYDFVIIDTPPALGIITINALTASTSIIIPVQADIYSLQGVNQLYETICTVRKYCNPNLQIKGILLTRFSSRSILSRQLLENIETIAHNLGTKVYTTKIREAIAIKESQANMQDIFSYAPLSNASKDYMDAIGEILGEE